MRFVGRWRWGQTLGILLILLSFVLYGLLLSLPVLPLEGGMKPMLALILVGGGEATFWIGGLFVGKELYQRYLNPYRWVCRSGSNKSS